MSPKTQKSRIALLIERLIDNGSSKQYHLFFQKYHEADIADALEELSLDMRLRFFTRAKPETAAEVLEEMALTNQTELISQLKTVLAATYIEQMDPDDAADLLEDLFETNEEIASNIIHALPKDDAADIKELLSYPEESAGAIMTLEFLSIPENLSVKDALHFFKEKNPPDSEISFYIYIVDLHHRLVGYTTLRSLVLADATQEIRDIRNDYPIKATVDMDQEVVASLIQKYDLIAIPVVDHENRLVGLITVDDVVDVVIEEATEDIYKLSGTTDIQEFKLLEGKLVFPIISRIPWLFMTILGGIISAYLINKYSSFFTTHQFTLALSLGFIPLLMGLGGNIGNQSSTIIVRGLSTGLISHHRYLHYIFRECLVGLSIGSIMATIIFILSQLFHLNLQLSMVIMFSVFINISVAALIGASIPIIFKRLGIDPAVASAPFISTTLDIIGLIIYFSITLITILLIL